VSTQQQQSTHDDTTIEDFDAISAAIQLYIDGSAQGDAAKLAEAFHPDAQMYGAVGDQRFDEPMTEFFKLVAETPAGDTFRARITSITQAGDAATATVAEDGFWGTLSFMDFFSLCRSEGRWRIVNKTFAHTGGEMPNPE
jgi:putative lumazine-binding protein